MKRSTLRLKVRVR